MDTLSFIDKHTCTHTHALLLLYLCSQFLTPNIAQLDSATTSPATDLSEEAFRTAGE